MTNDEFVVELLKCSSNAVTVWNAAVDACKKDIDNRKHEYTDLVGMTELINRLERLKK